jgi:hypothetical protein
MARPLIEGVQGEVRVRDDTACRLFPHIRPMAYRQVVEQALYRLERGEIETAWSDALSTSRGDIPPVMLTSQDGMILERRQLTVRALPKTVYRIFTGIGGERGWFYANWTWRLRGLLDRMIGGVGLRRGRRHPNEVRVGDALDFWRAEVVDPGHLIRLQAEMKVPGLAWLQFEARPQKDGQTQLFQTAFFAPKGLWGLLYWYILYPIHKLIFSGMIRRIGERAETAQVEGYIK